MSYQGSSRPLFLPLGAMGSGKSIPSSASLASTLTILSLPCARACLVRGCGGG